MACSSSAGRPVADPPQCRHRQRARRLDDQEVGRCLRPVSRPVRDRAWFFQVRACHLLRGLYQGSTGSQAATELFVTRPTTKTKTRATFSDLRRCASTTVGIETLLPPKPSLPKRSRKTLASVRRLHVKPAAYGCSLIPFFYSSPTPYNPPLRGSNHFNSHFNTTVPALADWSSFEGGEGEEREGEEEEEEVCGWWVRKKERERERGEGGASLCILFPSPSPFPLCHQIRSKQKRVDFFSMYC